MNNYTRLELLNKLGCDIEDALSMSNLIEAIRLGIIQTEKSQKNEGKGIVQKA